MIEFEAAIYQNEVLEKFHRHVFECIVEKVIIGGYDTDGNINPTQITFIYKTGNKNSVNGSQFKPTRKNARGRNKSDELCLQGKNKVDL